MKGYKTILFGFAVAIGSAVLGQLESLKAALGQCAIDATTNVEVCSLPSYVGVGVGVAIVVLRVLTTGPVLNKPQQ